MKYLKDLLEYFYYLFLGSLVRPIYYLMKCTWTYNDWVNKKLSKDNYFKEKGD